MQTGTVAIVRLGHDDGKVGNVAIHDRDLLAGQVSVAGCRGQPLGRRLPRALAESEGANRLAGREFGKPTLLLGVAAGHQDGLCCEIDGRRERYRRNSPAELFRDYGQFEVGQAEPAVLFGDRRGGPAEFRDLGPQVGVVDGVAVEDGAYCRHGAMFLKKPQCLLAQQVLFVGKLEIHGLDSKRT